MSMPKLRFSEFSQEWKPAKAGDAFNSRRTKGEEGIPIYSVTLDRGMVRRDALDRQILDDAADGANLRAQQGDLVYNMMRMWQGAVGIAPEDCMISPAYVVLAPKAQTSAEFFNHWFKSRRMIYLLWAYSQGLTSDRLRLYFKDFAQIPLLLPSLAEQTKIANFLTTVDEKITQLTQKCDLLKQYKNGVMQQIFSQELRFKDNERESFLGWKQVKLGDVAEVIMGQSPDSSSYNEFGNGTPLIQGNADIKNRKSKPRLWTDQPTKFCLNDDILLTVRAPVGAVAMSSHEACIGRGVCAIRSNTGTLTAYIYQVLLWFEPNRWNSIEQGSTFTAISGSDVKGLKIALPTVAEQTKIANFLTAIDDKISNARAQLASAKQYKQGLLQQMFV